MRLNVFFIVLIILSAFALFVLCQLIEQQEEEIEYLEEALHQQIQETEVYRGILEEYQT